MASLIPGFEYDIFISYRQKDNKHDGWVTEFVENLKGELESTFKEEISVYFDINPHDGLLETHDVDASLKEKLKCLVFIPIISRTYCDPKSFAWEHEFKAFIEQASGDQFGLKIKLTNGNVASRVLPVRIHDLDIADVKLCEYFLDGVLRGIEFIYKEPGVNRPLTPDDDEEKNLNRTRYKNQINKVALAINELMQGLMTEPEWEKFEKRIEYETLHQQEDIREQEKKRDRLKPAKSKYKHAFQGLLLLILLIASLIIAYPRLFKHNTLDKMRSAGERISVVILPFQNMTRDSTLNVWQEVIQDNLINFLGNYPSQLQVRQSESINSILKGKSSFISNSLTPSVGKEVSNRLNSDIFILGSFSKAGARLRINAELTDSKTEEVLKSFQIEGSSTEVNIFGYIDSLSGKIKDFLIVSKLSKKESPDFQYLSNTNSAEAYICYVQGKNSASKYDFSAAVSSFSKAVTLDSNFVFAKILLAFSYGLEGSYDEARALCLKVYKKRDLMPLALKNYASMLYATYFGTPYDRIKYLKQILETDDQLPNMYFHLANTYNFIHQYDKAIPEFEKALKIYHEWEIKPFWAANYTALGLAYHETRQYRKEKNLYDRAEKDFPDNPHLLYRQAILYVTEGDSSDSKRYIERYVSVLRENAVSEANIMSGLAGIYSDVGNKDKAEHYYRKTLALQPENPLWMNALAYFLIDKDRNVNEGMILIDRALSLIDENKYKNYPYLDTKGWGLYKQGKYKEALEFLQKSWELKPMYDHEVYLHLEAAKKAVAEQK
jgi:tetratricopeptide (TPR) repeat protein